MSVDLPAPGLPANFIASRAQLQRRRNPRGAVCLEEPCGASRFLREKVLAMNEMMLPSKTKLWRLSTKLNLFELRQCRALGKGLSSDSDEVRQAAMNDTLGSFVL
jgi:hypothetical protein